MCGNHTTSDEIFILVEMAVRKNEKVRLTAIKKQNERLIAIEAKGKLVIETKGTDCTGWLVTELDAVLAWHGVQKLNAMGKIANIEKWREIQRNNVQPKEC